MWCERPALFTNLSNNASSCRPVHGRRSCHGLPQTLRERGCACHRISMLMYGPPPPPCFLNLACLGPPSGRGQFRKLKKKKERNTWYPRSERKINDYTPVARQVKVPSVKRNFRSSSRIQQRLPFVFPLTKLAKSPVARAVSAFEEFT